MPRRRLNQLAWALAALALGWVAQGLFSRQGLWPGLLLYAIAIPLFATRLRTARQPQPPAAETGHQSPPSWITWGTSGRLGLASVVSGSLLLSGMAWYLFGLEANSQSAWLIYLGSLVFFGLGVWLLELSYRPGSQRSFPLARPQWRPDPWLLIILVVALFMRLFHFASLPFGTWYDEATAGLEARRVLQDPSFRPAFSIAMNQMAHHIYLFALSLEVLGDHISALRAVSVLFGMGAVLAAYLFGREYGGRRWGLLLAFLVATMRWHVNFSRIAMNGIDAPFFEFLTLYFALRVARERASQLRSIAWLGLTVGLGLCFYTAFRLFVLAGALFGLALLARFYAPHSTLHPPHFTPQRLLASLTCVLFAIWLAAMPTFQYAGRHSETFWGRARQVSIFYNREDPNLARALAQNLKKHLLMFNYKGDNNGRHNLPGAPTLDRLSAVLFALGIGLVVVRREPIGLFFLCVLIAGLLGGILTLDFEAPQALRSIGALPAVVYLIAISLDALWLELRRATGFARPGYSLAPALLGLGAIAFSNGFTYFGPQAHDPRVWMEFSTAETLVARHMVELGPRPVYYLSPFFFDHACIRFHAPADPALSVRKVMPLPDPLPAREPPERPVVYFIHPDEEWVFLLAQQLYPNARFETLPADPDYPPAVLVVSLEPGDVASIQGLAGDYWSGDTWDGAPQATSRPAAIDITWPRDAPLELPFAAAWEGVLYAPWYGQYRLGVEAPGAVQLTLDGLKLDGRGDLSLVQDLAQGNHALRLRAVGGRGQVRLWWEPPPGERGGVPSWALYRAPVSAQGLLGKYYANPDWQGTPAIERIDPRLDLYFHLTPLPRPYSVEWTGMLDIPSDGVYGLALRAVDRAWLYLDGRLVIETQAPDEYAQEMLALPAGPHALRITFQDLTGRSRIHLRWTPPGREPEIIPTAHLQPYATKDE